ncbi:hypothetical protein SAMN05216504_3615 [Pseudomonas sp. A214]|jgi:hypothetical protein|nr:hypothetical protein SAMN05216504_3615 [Pseudomonas sp. A214]
MSIWVRSISAKKASGRSEQVLSRLRSVPNLHGHEELLGELARASVYDESESGKGSKILPIACFTL